jgi:formylglycine-generating enzyme required for sulfatase activity
MKMEEIAEAGEIPGYEAVRLLGRGGMGVVYLARQEALGRTVAIKLLTPNTDANPTVQAARFRREAELMARASHTNIVAIHDFGVHEGLAFLVMEYVEGGDLGRRLIPEEPWSAAAIRPLVLPIARALACLHRCGILHRDLKPSNILMFDERTPKLADFGIAVLESETGELTRTNAAVGTLGYAAPEQQYNLKLDERTDQYSMAAVFYELATGRRPLGSFAPPSKYNHDLSPEVDEVMMRALREDREDRYPTVEEFGAEAGVRRRAFVGEWSSPTLRWAALGMFAAAVVVGGVLIIRPWARDPVTVPSADQTGPPRTGREAGPGAQAAVTAGSDGTREPILKNTTPRPASTGADALSGAAPSASAVATTSTSPARPESKTPKGAPSSLLESGRKHIVNSLGMDLVLIQPGTFMMGAPASEPGSDANERPRRPVRLTEPFYIATTETTVGAFRRFVKATGYKTDAERTGGGMVYDRAKNNLVKAPWANWRNPGNAEKPQGDDEPVVQVSWNDARAFLDWLSQREGRVYRLPTEAEWEYTCRAGTETAWCSGDDPAALDALAWTARNADHKTHPVASRSANPWAVFDMHGNAWEWCADYYAPYPEAAADNPTGPAQGAARVIRGGGWDWPTPEKTRSAARIGFDPSQSYFSYSFRAALTPVRPVVEKKGGA